MTIKQKDFLTVKIVDPLKNIQMETLEGVGKIKLSKTPKGGFSRKYSQFYTQKEAELSLSFQTIELQNRIYYLKSPVTFRITSDDKKSVTLENNLLDIYSFGADLPEAQQDLFEQFDFTYRRLTQIDDSKLSPHLLDAKKYISLIVSNYKDN
jgi:hypothetical protein